MKLGESWVLRFNDGTCSLARVVRDPYVPSGVRWAVHRTRLGFQTLPIESPLIVSRELVEVAR